MVATGRRAAKSKIVEAAAMAARHVIGLRSDLNLSARDDARMFKRAEKAILKVANHYNMDPADAAEQIWAEAQKRGGVMPIPGKDM